MVQIISYADAVKTRQHGKMLASLDEMTAALDKMQHNVTASINALTTAGKLADVQAALAHIGDQTQALARKTRQARQNMLTTREQTAEIMAAVDDIISEVDCVQQYFVTTLVGIQQKIKLTSP